MNTLTTSAGRKRHIRMAHQDIYSTPSEDTMPLTGKSGVQQQDNGTLLKEDISIDKPAKVEKALRVRFQTDNSKPIIAETFNSYGPYQSLPVTKPRDKNVDTASQQQNTQPTVPLNSSYSMDIKKLLSILIAIAIIVALVLIFIAVIVTCICCRTQPGQIQRDGRKISFCFNCVKSEGLPVMNYSTLPSGKNYN